MVPKICIPELTEFRFIQITNYLGKQDAVLISYYNEQFGAIIWIDSVDLLYLLILEYNDIISACSFYQTRNRKYS